jgi:hypothetical protein
MMMGKPDAVVFNLSKGVSILVNRMGVVTLMDGNELADISATGLGGILADTYVSKMERPAVKVAVAGRVN